MFLPPCKLEQVREMIILQSTYNCKFQYFCGKIDVYDCLEEDTKKHEVNHI